MHPCMDAESGTDASESCGVLAGSRIQAASRSPDAKKAASRKVG